MTPKERILSIRLLERIHKKHELIQNTGIVSDTTKLLKGSNKNSNYDNNKIREEFKMTNRMKKVLITVACVGVAVAGYCGINSYQDAKALEVEERMKTLEIQGVFEDTGEFITEEFAYDSEDGFQSFDTSEKVFCVFKADSSIDVKYEGVIEAGYALEDINFKVDASDKIVRISLPEAEIRGHELNVIEAVDHDSIFHRNDSNDLINIENEIKENAVIAAEINGIYDRAQDSVEDQLTAMVEDLTGYTVEFI